MSHLHRSASLSFGALALVSCSIARLAYAQADESIRQPPPAEMPGETGATKPKPAWGEHRLLNSNLMLTPMFVPSALVLSYVGLRTGIERAETDHVPFSPRDVDIKILRVAEGIDGGIRIIDRLGVFVNVAGIGTTSINQESLVVRGGSYRIVAAGGLILKVLELKRPGTVFSLRARAAGETGKIYNLLPLLRQLDARPVRSAVDTATGEIGDVLLTPFSGSDWGGDFLIAQPLGAMFSLQASASFTFQSATLRPYNLMDNARHGIDVTTTLPEFGLAAAFDARSLSVPVAIMLEWVISFPNTHDDLTDSSSSRTQNRLAFDAFYSGRSDLQTGFSIFGQWGSDPIEDRAADGMTRKSDERELVGAMLVLRYFW